MRAYLAYYRSGREQAEHGVFPRVVFLATTRARSTRSPRSPTRVGVRRGSRLRPVRSGRLAPQPGEINEEPADEALPPSSTARAGRSSKPTRSRAPALPERCVDAVVTDPPYGIGFADHDWDGAICTGGAAPGAERRASRAGPRLGSGVPARAQARRASCSPSAHPAQPTGSRPGIEDGGFELRDQLLWLYGSGVPEARPRRQRPLRHASSPPTSRSCSPAPHLPHAAPPRTPPASAPASSQIDDARIPAARGGAGRWPANVVLGHDHRCDRRGCVADCPSADLDRRGLGTAAEQVLLLPEAIGRRARSRLRAAAGAASADLRRRARPGVTPTRPSSRSS